MDRLAVTLCVRPLPVNRGKPSAVRRALAAAGHQVSEVEDRPLDLAGIDVVWMLGNANWFPRVCRQVIGTPAGARPFVVIAHGEPLPPPRAAGLPWPRLHLRELGKILMRDARATDVYSNYLRLRQLARHGLPNVLIVPSLGWREFLVEHDIAARWMPFPYDPAYGRDLHLTRDIDVLFLGALTVPRRRRLIRRLQRGGIDLVAMGSWTDPACWGESRTRVLNRTKILLNLARYPGELAGQRLLLGMANKALVISEPIYAPAPFLPGVHYVSAAVAEMPGAIERYLNDEAARLAVVERAYRFITADPRLNRPESYAADLLAAEGVGRRCSAGGGSPPQAATGAAPGDRGPR